MHHQDKQASDQDQHDEPSSHGTEEMASTRFEQTRWSLVLRFREENTVIRQQALGDLCKAYWYPLYVFLRRSGRGVEDAQDLVQEFFVRLSDWRLLGAVDPALGKFRTLLLSALRQVDVDAWRAAQAQKRGGGIVHVAIDGEHAEERFLRDSSINSSPELAFDRAWAAAVMERAWERLRLSYATPELSAVFAELAPRLSNGKDEETLADIGQRLDMSGDAVKKAFSRMRRRFGEALRAEVAETVGSSEAAQEELRHLLLLFS